MSHRARDVCACVLAVVHPPEGALARSIYSDMTVIVHVTSRAPGQQ